MFGKIQMILMMKTSISNNRISRVNNLSAEKINLLKALMRNKDIIIHTADKGNNVVIADKERYIEDVKRVISDSNKFVQLNITPDKYLNYTINIEKKLKQL